ncbi:MAG TPA: pitrilysin family protein [Gemmatimonadaceae bacterium]|nr:pitrilysin family protein [Gemmatimonadaceae bacterium]
MSVRRTLSLITLATLATSAALEPAFSQAATGQSASVSVPRIPYTKFVLSNGLTLLVHEDHKAPIAAVNVWYHVGSKNEKPGKTGFAHLFEHLMFNGSENFNDDYFSAVEPVGATDLNGTTSEDRTNYFQNVPVSALDRILWLESDRMGHLLGAIDQAVLDEQRGVVQNEKRQSENQPYGRMFITATENTYPAGHPYSWSVIGSMEDLGAASLDDVKEWFRTYYGPNNAVLVVAGDVRPDDIKARVERFFGDIPAGPPIAKQQEWIAKRSGTHRQVMEDRVPQARIVKVWNTPGFANMESVPLEMAQDILSTGKTSRLYRRLVYTDRLATSVTGFTDAREAGGQVWLWADAQPDGDLAKVEAAMDDEIARFLRDGPTADELEQARVRMRSNYVRGIERIGGFGGKSDILAQGMVFGDDPDLVPKKIELSQRTTAAQVRDAARKWLGDGQYVLEVRPYPEYTTVASNVDRSKLPDPGAPPDVSFPVVENDTLSNGLRVQLVRRTAVPVVTASLMLDAGYTADKFATPGTSNLTFAMLDEGTASRTSQQISDQLALLGATLSTGSALDVSYVTVNALKDKLTEAMSIWSDVVLHPSFPESDFNRLRAQTLAAIQQEKVQPVGMALRVLPLLLYGPDHAYGMPLTGSGTEESVKDITRADLGKFHATWFKPNHAVVQVVGDITMAELTPQLERAFQGWRAGDTPDKEIATVAPRESREVFLLDRPGADQTIIFAAQLIPPRAYENETAFETFNDAFGGAFGSRINMNLREDKHWSYGAASIPFDARGQRLWFVYAPVQTDKTAESVQEVVKELADVVGPRPISADELQVAKDRQTRTLAGRWETGGAVLGAMREMEQYDLPADYYRTFADRVRGVTTANVAEAVTDVIHPDRAIYVLVGDRAKIEAGIRALNLGPVRLLDADGRPLRPTP